MRVIPFQAWHLFAVQAQAQQANALSITTLPHAQVLEGPNSFTMLDADHQPLGSAGVMPKWGVTGVAWAFLSDRMHARELAAGTRYIRQYLATAPFDRIEIQVDAGFIPGEKWARLLGFERETPEGAVMRKAQPTGADATMWSMVR